MSGSPSLPSNALTAENLPVSSKRDEGLPIKLLSRHLACENTVFSVCLDHVMDANGQEVLQYLSVFPKNRTKDSVSGVGILLIKEGKYGLLRIYRHPLQRWSWELPRGMIETGETAVEAALRESREETGISIYKNQINEIGVAAPAAALVAGRIRLFTAVLSGNEETGNAHSELGLGELKFFSRREIAESIASGDIEDACTLSALLLHAIQQGCLVDEAGKA